MGLETAPKERLSGLRPNLAGSFEKERLEADGTIGGTEPGLAAGSIADKLAAFARKSGPAMDRLWQRGVRDDEHPECVWIGRP